MWFIRKHARIKIYANRIDYLYEGITNKSREYTYIHNIIHDAIGILTYEIGDFISNHLEPLVESDSCFLRIESFRMRILYFYFMDVFLSPEFSLAAY